MVFFTEMVHNAGDAERPSKAKQVCHETVGDAEEERFAESLS